MATTVTSLPLSSPLESYSFYNKLNAPSPYLINSQVLLKDYIQRDGYAQYTKDIIKSPNDDRQYR